MGVLIGMAIGIAAGLVIVIIRHYLFLRNMPDDVKRTELVAAILEMKSRDCTYQERLAWLKKAGLRKQVADVLLGEVERAAPLRRTD